jgi:Phage minor structural protein GP20
MNKKDLEKLGLTAEALAKAELPEDVLEKIIVAHSKDIEGHKNKLTEAMTAADNTKQQLEEANKQIEGFKGMDVDGIKQAADQWKAQAEQAEKDFTAQVQALKFDHALSDTLAAAKVKNTKAVKALLDREGLKLNEKDGSILGLDKQLEVIKESDPYLFTDDKMPDIVRAATNQPVITKNNVARSSALQAAGIYESDGNKQG